MGAPLLLARHRFDPLPLGQIRTCPESRKMFRRSVRGLLQESRWSILASSSAENFYEYQAEKVVEINEYIVRKTECQEHWIV